ncbi:MAG: hypothetical protein ACPGVV_03835, partial [Croceimicrobium sp.]
RSTAKLSLRDMSGRLVYSSSMEEHNSGAYLEISAADFDRGIYQLMVERDGQFMHETVVLN